MKLTCGLRRGNCKTTILLNLASESIIRKTIEAIIYKIYENTVKITSYADGLLFSMDHYRC